MHDEATVALEDAMSAQPHLARYLVHLRQRLIRDELTVVIGAGATTDAGPPLWDALLERIRESVRNGEDPDLEAYKKMGIHQATVGTILRRRFDANVPDGEVPLKIDDDWFRVIQSAIYRDVPEDRGQWFNQHSYLLELTKLCYRVKLIVNFNFDDIISESMKYYAHENSELNLTTPSVIWKPTLLERSDSALIYHINGVMTKKVGKKRSETLVFTEDSFYDAELRSPRVKIDHVLARFVSTTMFLIGHSLADNSLKGYLRQSKMIKPANHHYFIHWVPNRDMLSDEQMSEIFEANRELYNLITLFLTSDEINYFLKILNDEEDLFLQFIEKTGTMARLAVYIVGPVAAGKTSVLEYLRCFDTHEEWIGENPQEMYLASTNIDDDTEQMIDGWVYTQIAEKNEKLKAISLGFVFIDRGPLDLFAFAKDTAEWPGKARIALEKLGSERLIEGKVALLTADGETLEARNWKRGRAPEIAGDKEYLSNQALVLESVYPDAQVFRTDRLSPAEIAADIAREALFGDHDLIDLHERLVAVSRGNIE